MSETTAGPHCARCGFHHLGPCTHPPLMPPKGCVCPPTSELTCQRLDCGRKNPFAGNLSMTSPSTAALVAEDLPDREAVARLCCYWADPAKNGSCHDAYCSHKCIAVMPEKQFFDMADAIVSLFVGRAALRPQSEGKGS